MASWTLRQCRTIAFDEQGRVAQEMPCAQCCYDLRGKTARERCPDCETGVWRAIRAARSPRRWHPLWDVAIVAALVAVLVAFVDACGDFHYSTSVPCISIKKPWICMVRVTPPEPEGMTALMTNPIDGIAWPWALTAALLPVWIIHRRARKTPGRAGG